MPENNNLDSANGAPCSYTTGDGSLRWPCAVHPPKVYGPYRVKWIGTGVWAGITDELPAEIEGKDVFISTARAALAAQKQGDSDA